MTVESRMGRSVLDQTSVLSVMKSVNGMGSGDAGAGNGWGSRSSWGRFHEFVLLEERTRHCC
jgi:hypothetical protein